MFLSIFKLCVNNRIQCLLLYVSYSAEDSVNFGVPLGSVLGSNLFNLLKNPFVIATCWQMTQHSTPHTSVENIFDESGAIRKAA